MCAVVGHFNSAYVQQREQAELPSLSLTKFVEKDGTMAEALSSLATHIANKTPQCSPCFRSESNKVDFLKQDVVEQSWAHEVPVRIKPSTQFQLLYTELANALQFHQEILQKTGKNSFSSRTGSSNNASKPFIYFTQPRVLKSMFPGNQDAPSSWNCGLRGHRFTDCHKPLDMNRIADNQSKYYAKRGDKKSSTRRVLFELVEGLNHLCNFDGDSFNTGSVRAFFGDLRCDDDDSSSSSEWDNDSGNVQSMFTTTNGFTMPDDDSKSDSAF